MKGHGPANQATGGERRRFSFSYDLQTLRGDLFGGVTAAVVGLPVALAFGVASGLGALAGIYGAIAVGFFAAVFGGTRSQISGPTGPMAIAVAVIVATHADNLARAFTIVIMAGLIQVLLGVMRVGRFVAFTHTRSYPGSCPASASSFCSRHCRSWAPPQQPAGRSLRYRHGRMR